MSDNNSTKRPILQQIWLLWTTVLQYDQMRLVLSGTGIEHQALTDPWLSPIFALKPYRTKSEIGAFENPETQAQYMCQLFGPTHTGRNFSPGPGPGYMEG
jgi:hypothetical protein